jgi:hypothetical protein
MTTSVGPLLPRPSRPGLVIAIAVLRGLGTTILLSIVYVVSPLERMATIPLWAIVVGGTLILAAVTIYQVRSILGSAQPVARAIEALTLTGPLFLLLFASTYFLMSRADPANFNVPGLTRLDALYFTITVFTTVGFGDIVASSESARALVMAQMILDLILIGAVIRGFVEAVRFARRQSPTSTTR